MVLCSSLTCDDKQYKLSGYGSMCFTTADIIFREELNASFRQTKFATKQDPMKFSQNRFLPVSSICLLSVEKL